MRILVLGASGMLGNAMFRVLSEKDGWLVHGTIRSENSKQFFKTDNAERLLTGVDIEQNDSLMQAFIRIKPDVVINCVGLVKQVANADDPLQAIPINALLPHRLAKLCELSGARLVHFGTDCVFTGEKGNYNESDTPDTNDLYGRSKLLGEVAYQHTVTLRTSIIGHELQGTQSLIGWFLSQKGQCKGFTRAIFSGLPTVVLAQIVRDVVIQHTDLSGVYHIAAQPISKYKLLELVAEVYDKKIEIIPDDHLVIDRSLNAKLFEKITGYVAPNWERLIKLMYSFQ